jgi:hypothetical protein
MPTQPAPKVQAKPQAKAPAAKAQPQKKVSFVPPKPDNFDDLDPDLQDILEDEDFWNDIQENTIEPANKNLWDYFCQARRFKFFLDNLTASIGKAEVKADLNPLQIAFVDGVKDTAEQMTGDPEVAKKWLIDTDLAEKYFDERGGQFITQVSDTDRNRIRDSLVDNWGVGKEEFDKQFEEDLIFSEARAELIYHEETHQANEAGSFLFAYNNGGRWKMWVTGEDERTCDICSEQNGQVRPIDQPFDTGSMGAHGHIGCFLPETKCLPLGGLVGGTKSWYDGPIIQLSFGFGGKLSITPNHPILTPNGLIPAKLLKEGDDVIYSSDLKGVISIDADNEGVISTIEEIFNSLLISPQMHSIEMPVTAEDFHGDGKFIKGNINVVRSKGLLRGRGDTLCFKHLAAKYLNPRNIRLSSFMGLGLLASKLNRMRFSPRSIMGGSGPLQSLFGGSLPHSQIHRFASPPRDDLLLPESQNYNVPSALEMISNRFDGHASSVESDNFIRGNFYPPIIAGYNPSPLKTIEDQASRTLKLFSKPLKCSPGLIESDKVIGINILSYHGFVYDLESISSLLICNGVFASNCRCTVYYFESPPTEGDTTLEGLPEDFNLSEWDKYTQVDVPEIGYSGEGGAAYDEWKDSQEMEGDSQKQ